MRVLQEDCMRLERMFSRLLDEKDEVRVRSGIGFDSWKHI